MFEYQRLYWNHLRGEHLKVVLNIVLYVILSSIVSIIGIGLGFTVIGRQYLAGQVHKVDLEHSVL
uniref:hypothetical protein n=1 Tax=Nosocomiicoccus ampullae TaxID=489910 RepID=UPI0008337882|nr:hypothetical protein [Nosocomiicoccus ampullae]